MRNWNTVCVCVYVLTLHVCVWPIFNQGYVIIHRDGVLYRREAQRQTSAGRDSNSGCGRSKECAEGNSPHPLSFLFLCLPLACPLSLSLFPQAPPSLSHLATMKQVYTPRQASGCLACVFSGAWQWSSQFPVLIQTNFIDMDLKDTL